MKTRVGPSRRQPNILPFIRPPKPNTYMRPCAPLPGISEAMKTLAAAHVYIRVVTHRLFVSGQHRMVVADTAQWLDDNDIPYMSLCFTGLKDSVQATVHIDDSPANIESLRAVGQHVVIFDQPYNRHLPGPRIEVWNDETVALLLSWFDRWPQE